MAAVRRQAWVVPLGFVLVAYGLLTARQPLVGLVGALGIAVLALAVGMNARVGTSLLWPLGVVALLQPWNGLRPISGATVGDIALVGVVVFALLNLPAARVRLRLLVPLIGTLFILSGGILGMLATAGDIDRSLQTPADVAQIWVPVSLLGTNAAMSQMIKFIIGAPMMLIIFMILNPNWRTAVFLSRMFAIGCAVNGAAAILGFDVDRDFSRMIGRSAGFANLATHLSLTGIMGFAVGIGWAMSAQRWSSRLLGGVVSGLCLSAVILSGTRAAFIACGVVALYFAILGRARGIGWFAGIGAAGLVLMLSIRGFLPPENAINRLLGAAGNSNFSVNYSNEDHLKLMARSFEEIATHPFTGTGFFSGLLAHNMVFMAANIGGPLALLGLLIAVGWMLFMLGNVLVKGVPIAQWHRVGPLAGVLGFLVFGQFQNIFWDRYIWFFICVALLCVPSLTRPKAEEKASAAEPAMAA